MWPSNCDRFLKVYRDVARGSLVTPRGSKCREVEDYMFELDMSDSPLTSFRARNLNLRYAKEEMLWYLRADKFDKSIEKHATMWQKIRQPDGSYFSNYGQYIFPHQFLFVISELLKDPWSRRASIVLLQPHHLFHDNSDVVCTYSINFRIRNGLLNMSVNMRSNDVIFGMTNDVFCFSMLYRMIFVSLRSALDVWPGVYRHKVDSLHVYERHFEMIEDIVREDSEGYTKINVPWPTKEEVLEAMGTKSLGGGAWSDWMRE